MTNIEIIKDIAKHNNGLVTKQEAIKKGVASWYFTEMTRSGQLERIGRGIYLVPSYDNYDELFIFQQRNQRCIYSYQSALSLHGLTDRIPYQEEVTVPQGYNASRISNEVTVHYIVGRWYKTGIQACKTEMGNTVLVYDMERTICDLIRDRKKQDPEIFSKAVHIYLKRKDKDIWKLRDYAKTFRITEKLEEILEVAVSE